MSLDICHIASEWHSGQWSDMYKLASSGYIEDVDGLISEINACIRDLSKFPEDERDDLEAGLQGFLLAVELREDLRYDRESGWLMAHWCRAYSEGVPAINPERWIQIAANDIESLRSVDVYRVLDQFETYGEAEQMARWIIEQREELEPEVDQVMAELAEPY